MTRPINSIWRVLGTVFVVAAVLNYPWEMLQAPLYVMDTAGMPMWLHCFNSSLGDGSILLLLLGLGWAVFGRVNWFVRAGARHYALMLGAGLLIGIGLEWIFVRVLEKWSYSPRMPRLPLTRVGAIPVLQMLLLPPLIFWLAAAWLSRGRSSEKKASAAKTDGQSGCRVSPAKPSRGHEGY
ncbi:MAG: hypothetical protein M3167_08805 [Acidobacteriota bacterium]|nr:hypothetical protein [Acidobacteriota bacterium]